MSTQRRSGRRNPALFSTYWTDPQDGRRLGRATQRELREANRLYWKIRKWQRVT